MSDSICVATKPLWPTAVVQCCCNIANAVECSKVNEMVAVVALANRCTLSDHHKPERATKLLSVKWPSFEATRRLQVWVPLQECVHELQTSACCERRSHTPETLKGWCRDGTFRVIQQSNTTAACTTIGCTYCARHRRADHPPTDHHRAAQRHVALMKVDTVPFCTRSAKATSRTECMQL